jgi:tetratricopeptide (TPR) repeat protein
MPPRVSSIAAGLLAASMPWAAWAQDSAIDVLVKQGQYWQQRNNTERSGEAWEKLLRIDPAQPDALYGLGIDAVKANKPAEARKYLDRLRALDPNSLRVARLNQAIELGGGEGKRKIEQARLAVQSNDVNSALENYRAAFRNVPQPTGDIALEYYSRLGYTAAGRAEALRNLQRLSGEEPGNNEIRLNIAQITALDEKTRVDGIRALQKLSTLPDVGGAATESWREALGFLGNPPRKVDAPVFEAYLKAHPEDDEIRQQFANIGKAAVAGTGAAAPIDPLRARTDAALRAMGQGDMATAEAGFNAVLKSRPDYADALGGLGVVRMRQQRFDDASSLLGRAVRNGGIRWKDALASASYWTLVARANTARQAGDTATADRLLRQAMSLSARDPAAASQLASIAAGEGRLDDAERLYRAALAVAPNDADALRGLVSVLARSGKESEASRVIERLAPSQRAAIGNVDTLRAALDDGRAQAALARGDNAAAQAALQQAVKEDPADPWTRVSLARLYLKAGDKTHAVGVMDALTAARPDDVQALYASALVSSEAKEWNRSLATLRRIPEQARTADMALLERRTWVESQAALASRLAKSGRRKEALNILGQTAGYAGQDPDMLGALALAYVDAGDAPTGAAMLRDAMARRNPPPPALSLQYASLLLKTGRDAELVEVLRALQRQRLSPADQDSFDNLRVLYIARQAEALRQRDDLVAAYDVLAPVLQERPNDPLVVGTLARMYASAQEYPKALDLYKRLQRSDPDNVDVQLGAAQMANRVKDYDYADTAAQKAIALAPNSPDVLASAARIYREQGKTSKAAQLLQAALAAQQSGGDGTRVAAASPAAVNPFVGLPGQRSQSTLAMAPLPLPEALASASGNSGQSAAYIPPPASSLPSPAPYQAPARPPQYAYADTAPAAPGYAPPPGYAPAPGYVPAPGYAAAPGYAPPAAYAAAAAAGGAGYAPAAGTPGGRAAPPAAQAAASPSIQQELDQLMRGSTPYAQVGLLGRNRNGESGMGKLDDIEAPSQARLPVGDGNLFLRVTPTTLQAGSVGKDYGSGSRFGGGPAAALAQQNGTTGAAGSQSDHGVGLSVAYETTGLSADLGTTPIGFRYTNVIGGVKLNRPLDDSGLSYTAEVSRRPVTDSLLSFAGAHDARTGQSWGAVAATGIRLQLTQDYGDHGVYGYGSWQSLDGRNVESNTRVEGGVGLYKYLLRDTNYELTSGLNLTAMSYDKNLSYFTYGQGGYFSPQQYYALSVPVGWAQRQGNFSYQVRGSLGVQYFSTDSSPYFPTNGSLQNAANAAAAIAYAQGLTDTPNARYDGQSKTGVGYSLATSAEYQVGPQLFVGGMASIDNSRDYRQWVGGLYARYTFDAVPGGVSLPAASFKSPYAQ